MTQEEYEYHEFMATLVDKTRDLSNDYSNLSIANKQRVEATIQQLIMTYGMTNLISAICQLRL